MNEITRLVDLLGSGDAAEHERVLALLAIHGRRAVEPLLAASSSSQPHQRAQAIVALGRIGDPRARRAVTLALSDRSAEVRSAAATAVAAYPAAESVQRLRGMMQREPEVEVRVRATGSLLEIFLSGSVEALDPLLDLARNPAEDRRVRLEALKVLASLPPSEAKALAGSLAGDTDGRVARLATMLAGESPEAAERGAEEALAELDSTDYFTQRRAAALLGSLGEPAIPLLVRALRARAADPAACARLASVLKQASRGRERSLARLIEEIDEIVPLGLAVDIIGGSRDRTALYHLKAMIDRLSTPEANGDQEGLAKARIVAKAHHYLARAGSRVAFEQLKATLARRDAPLMAEVLMAAEEIGGPEELLDLLAHEAREEGWMRERIRESFRRLMRKARIRIDDPIFERLDEERKARAVEIASGADPGPGRGAGTPRRKSRRVDTA